jgi:flagellar hook-associated protein FlgK
MSGIGMVLNTAKHALAAQQIGLNVTGHNIANVNTEHFSRQTPVLENRDTVHFNGFILGTGVGVGSVVRSSSSLLENKLMDQKSELERYDEAQSYMSILEGLFNETSETGLSKQISAFWNSWHDLSNMPTGFPERLAVYDTGARLAEQFQWLSDSMHHMGLDLESEVQAGIYQINTLADQIAEINVDIVGDSVNNNPNDQLDKRNALVNELAQLIDLQTYEQSSGALTVATNTGHMLVYGADTFKLEMRSGQVNWVDSQSGGVDITDKIKGGKLGGWLEMRDEVIPKYSQDLDAMAGEFIWSVNQKHSQGVGLDFFSNALSSTSRTDSSQMFNTLDFGDRIDYTGDFKMWVKNTGVIPPTLSNIAVDMDVSNVTVNNWGGAAPGSFQYRIAVTTAGTVGPAGTDPVLSWERFNPDGTATGVTGAVTVTDVNTLAGTVDGLTFNINAGDLYEGNTFTVNTDAAGAAVPLAVTATGAANSANDTYTFRVLSGGDVGTDPIQIEWAGSHTSEIITLDPGALPLNIDVDGMSLQFAGGTLFANDVFTISTSDVGAPLVEEPGDWQWSLSSFASTFNNAADAAAGAGPGSGYVQASVTSINELMFTPSAGYEFAFSDDQVQDSGMAAALGFNTFFTGGSAIDIAVNSVLDDKDNIAAARIDGITGEYGVGDNSNANAIAEIQYTSRQVAQWTFERRSVDRSGVTSNTMEGYYQGMIGSMGIKSASLVRNTEFSQVMVEKIKEQRDALSGVNLDEEMINLMKYQHAFAVASKLLTTADEMLQTLLSVK